MASAWDRAKEMADKHASTGGIFVRLANDGDKVVGAFCGEPDAREVHWTGEKYEECAGPGCAHCKQGTKVTLRVSMNFFVPAEGTMKVIEGGSMWLRDLLTVKDKYGLEKWTFEVKRVGKPKDPKTKYQILPDTQIDARLRARIDAMPLHDLAAIGRGDAYEGPAASPAATIDTATATELHTALKALPKPEVGEFFRVFNIGRLTELRAADLAEARAFVARVVGGGSDEVPF